METNRKLLLADDSITIQKVVRLTFADEGLDVTTVGTGDLAVEKIEELIPDIVLADVHMPGLNGYEVCEFVKRNERFRHIPVMLLVGSFEPFDEAEARRVGADDHLTKPFQSIRQLVNRIGAMLSGSTAGAETPTKELDPNKIAPDEVHLQSDEALPTASPPGFETLEPDANTGVARGDAFSDPSLDDAMIETTPVGVVDLHTQDTLRMQEFEMAGKGSPAGVAEAHQAEPLTKAYSADNGLLDLGDDRPELAMGGHDESILDIWDDNTVQPGSPLDTAVESPVVQYDGVVTEVGPSTDEIVKAASLDESAHTRDKELYTTSPLSEAQTASPHSGLITLEQLSPEVIDAIARRAVEQLSEKVIEQIAWEVVPDLAERLINRRLEQEGKM